MVVWLVLHHCNPFFPYWLRAIDSRSALCVVCSSSRYPCVCCALFIAFVCLCFSWFVLVLEEYLYARSLLHYHIYLFILAMFSHRQHLRYPRVLIDWFFFSVPPLSPFCVHQPAGAVGRTVDARFLSFATPWCMISLFVGGGRGSWGWSACVWGW